MPDPVQEIGSSSVCASLREAAENDAADAEAIVIAARQPEMRFVLPKTEEQQSRAALFRAKERLVHQRTELVNALRALLYEFGHVLPAGIRQLSRIDALLDTEDGALPLCGTNVEICWSRSPRKRSASTRGHRKRSCLLKERDWPNAFKPCLRRPDHGSGL